MGAERYEAGEDLLDIRDIIARFEDLRDERSELKEAIEDADNDDDETDAADRLDQWTEENEAEFETLKELLGALEGNGGDEQWEGAWYPVTLIRDSYFKQYAMDFADDIGAINSEASWPNTCIDWDQATKELQMDYDTVVYGGITYWYR